MLKLEDLPQDTKSLQAALLEVDHQLAAREETIASKEERIAWLEHRIHVLEKLAFGPRSEKLRPVEPDLHARQGALLFPELCLEAQRLADEAGAVGTMEIQASRKPRVPKGRRAKFPAHLPRVRTTLELPREKRQCCGQTMEEMGAEITRELERVEVCVVHEVVRKKYCCRKCQTGVKTAPGPARVIRKGLLGASFLAQTLVERFGNHMPYNRLEKKYASEGLGLSRVVLCQSARKAGDLLEPVWKELCVEVLETGLVNTDDTPVTIQKSGSGGRKTGRVWIYADQAGRQFYDFTEFRSRAGPAKVLAGYRGFLQADAYPAYDAFFGPEGATELGCWAHTRRYFERAEDSDPELSKEAVARIGELYAVEKAARERKLPPESTRDLRRKESKPRLDALKLWMARIRPTVLDKSPLARAIDYARSNWKALTRYVEDGRLEIDNNRAERSLRAVVLGRKNSYDLPSRAA